MSVIFMNSFLSFKSDSFSSTPLEPLSKGCLQTKPIKTSVFLVSASTC